MWVFDSKLYKANRFNSPFTLGILDGHFRDQTKNLLTKKIKMMMRIINMCDFPCLPSDDDSSQERRERRCSNTEMPLGKLLRTER